MISTSFQGSSRPLVIKFAESKKTREEEFLLSGTTSFSPTDYWQSPEVENGYPMPQPPPSSAMPPMPSYPGAQSPTMDHFLQSPPYYHDDEGLPISSQSRYGSHHQAQLIPTILRPHSVPPPSQNRDRGQGARPAEGFFNVFET
jgi:hypothetical protein